MDEPLYVVEDPMDSRAFRAETTLDPDEALALTRGEWKPERPIILGHSEGSQWTDFVWTDVLFPMIVSTRVVELLRRHGLDGWSLYPIDLQSAASPPQEYHGLAVTGRCGKMDKSKRELVVSSVPGSGVPIYRGVFCDMNGWDQSDIFTSSSQVGWVFATSALRRVFHGDGVSNVDFMKQNEIETEHF